jgi:hypothetical protein
MPQVLHLLFAHCSLFMELGTLGTVALISDDVQQGTSIGIT